MLGKTLVVCCLSGAISGQDWFKNVETSRAEDSSMKHGHKLEIDEKFYRMNKIDEQLEDLPSSMINMGWRPQDFRRNIKG